MSPKDNKQPKPLKVELFNDPEAAAVLGDLILMIGQLQRQLNNLQADVDVIKTTTARTHGAVGQLTFVRPKWVRLRYDHRDRELMFNDSFRMRFDSNEAALLALMFSQKTGLPKKQKFYCAEVAEHFQNINSSPRTAKAVHQTISRIDAKVRQQTRLEAFYITTKEFYNLSR